MISKLYSQQKTGMLFTINISHVINMLYRSSFHWFKSAIMFEFDCRDFRIPSSSAWLSRRLIRFVLFSLFLSRLWNFLSYFFSPRLKNSSAFPEDLKVRLVPSLLDNVSFFLLAFVSRLASNLSSVMAKARFVRFWTKSLTLSLSVGLSFWRSFWTSFFTVDFSVSSNGWAAFFIVFCIFSARIGWDWLIFFPILPVDTRVSKCPSMWKHYLPTSRSLMLTSHQLHISLEEAVLRSDVDQVAPDVGQLVLDVDSRPRSEWLLSSDFVRPGCVAREGPPLAGLISINTWASW